MPLYPVLPALFIFFLLSITVNVLRSQPRQALLGSVFLVLGFPLYLAMRRLSGPSSKSRAGGINIDRPAE